MNKRPVPVFNGRIVNGQIKLDRAVEFAALRARLEGCEIDVVLRKHRKPRSLSQNAWYWSCIVPLLAEVAGYDDEEMHAALKMRFLRNHGDSELPSVRSTSDLDTAEFTEYIERCRQLAAEFYGLVIPDPGEAE